ncbi:MAG: histidine--tRNA ligase [Chloroflexi bacterium RBG_13_57_8]|nr:MAG: histidine--tRNA ligase [Chloroflexi bacterium RBG_13_57_8]
MYQAARGTTDILPAEQPYWRYVEKAIAEITRLYGYQRIDTPVFEDTTLFRRSAGDYTDIVQKEMYTFDDRGGNSLTLKPEGTPAVCRAYIQHGMQNLPQPVKLFYISPIFRYDRPQAGRYRQHYQFGCEAIGEGDPALDAEVIDMAWLFYKSLGLSRLSLQLNSIGCKVCRPGYLAALKEYYAGFGNLCDDCKTRIEKNPLRLLDCKQTSCQSIAQNAPHGTARLCPDCAAHFSQLQKYLELMDIPFSLNHRLVRGLDYYTRTVFEVQPEEEGGQSTIGGGGRYDDLIEELGGKPAPAIGFATGIERIILNLKKHGIGVPETPGPQALIASMGDKGREAALKLAASLRREGISAVCALGEKSLKAQLRQANALKARFTLIIGEDEVKAGSVTLRDMAGASQETVTLSALAEKLKSK